MIRNTRYFPGESEKGASPAGYYDLAAAVVHRAVRDMRGIDAQALLNVLPKPGRVSLRERANGPQRRVLERGIEALTEMQKCRDASLSSIQKDYRDKME